MYVVTVFVINGGGGGVAHTHPNNVYTVHTCTCIYATMMYMHYV